MTSVRVAVVGPLPPPAGGMAGQTRQLGELLASEGVHTVIVQVNSPYRPAWIASVPVARAIFRLCPYILRLWSVCGHADVFHIMASSGWSWHLFAAPAVWVAKLRGKKVIINYRGGAAREFLETSLVWIRPTLKLADHLVVPSGYLQEVFGSWGIATTVIPNIVNLRRFAPPPGCRVRYSASPHLVITRNLEPVYDVATALKAFAMLLKKVPGAHLTIAGSGPLRESLEVLAVRLSINAHVRFAGRLEADEVALLYQSADLAVNPSLVDNMPNSILEALACGVPVVSTNVGGVPFTVDDGKTALLVPAGDAEAMAEAMLRLIRDESLARELSLNGLERAREFSWANVRGKWLSIYGKSEFERRASGSE